MLSLVERSTAMPGEADNQLGSYRELIAGIGPGFESPRAHHPTSTFYVLN